MTKILQSPCLFPIKLLFASPYDLPSIAQLKTALQTAFNRIEVMSENVTMPIFTVHDFQTQDQKIPTQLSFMDIPVKQDQLNNLIPDELRNDPNAIALYEKVTHQLLVTELFSQSLPYQIRWDLINKWQHMVHACFSNCLAVYYPTSGSLLTSEQFKEKSKAGSESFIYGGVNFRRFNLIDSSEIIIDTLGMYALGLPDLQFCFNHLNFSVDQIMQNAFSFAMYIFDNGNVINDGDSIDVLGQKVKCHYAQSLVEPTRNVIYIDLCQES